MKKIQHFLASILIVLFFFAIFTTFLYSLKPNLKVISKSYNKDFLIFDYQLSKINKSNGLKYVFIGDSSLGNGIDAFYFERYTNIKSSNFALSDIYGLSGQYNLLKKIISKNKQTLDKVFLITSIYFPLTDHEDEAFFITSNNFKDFLYSKSKLKFIKHIYQYSIKSFLVEYKFEENKYNLFFNETIFKDYIKQSEKHNLEAKKISNDMDFSKKIFYLNKMIELCEKHNVKLIKMYGQLYINKQKEINTYLHENNKIFEIVKKKNFIKYDEVIRFEEYQLGDQLTHIKPEYKIDITKKYIDFLNSKNLL